MIAPIFISLDIETFGPIPGVHAMVELGAAAYNIEGEVVGTWRATLAEPQGTVRDSATMKWWHMPAQYPVFEELTTGDIQDPSDAMAAFSQWASSFGKPEPVAYPAGFDYMFLYWYLIKYLGHSRPFSFSCIDLKSYAMAALKKTSYRKTAKNKFPKAWFNTHLPHTHNALDDAIEQGFTFIQAYRANLGLPLLPPDREITILA